jgi:ribonuclease P protein component
MAENAPSGMALGRADRLRASRDFLRLKRDGRRQAQGVLVLNWAPAAAGRKTRLGVVTSRQVGSAVERNRARRLLREAFRRNRSLMEGAADVVLVARQSIRGRAYETVERDLMEALRRARLLAPPATASKVD